jgi:transposase
MPMQRVEVITSVERRRRWSLAEKERLVAASLEPGVSVSEVARAAGLHVSQLFRWRKQLCIRLEPPATATEPLVEPKLVPVTIVPMTATDTPPPRRRRRRSGMIEIEVSGGRRVRVGGDVDAEALRRVLDVLEER